MSHHARPPTRWGSTRFLHAGRPKPAIVISLLALVLSMSSGAMAARLITGADVENVHPDRIAIVGKSVGVGTFLPQAQGGDAWTFDREVVDRFALLAARLAKA
jgi:hypothetical protein